ncbi:MAG: hypothetical protein GWP10_19040 [Nitrospiraceae bacterium]|nr:hypothetical protein [Nitrospiraceae bacterium]
MKRHNKKRSVYVSVYPYRSIRDDIDNIECMAGIVIGKPSRLIDYDTAILNTVYIDLDSEEDLEIACKDAIALYHGLEHEEIHTRQYFSGGKGFAFYIDFEPVQIDPVNFKGVLKEFLNRVESTYGLTTIDHSSTDGVSRISKIANTQHEKTGLYCVPVTTEDLQNGIDHILEIAQQPRTDIDICTWIRQNTTANTLMPTILKNLEKHVVHEKQKEERRVSINRLDRMLNPQPHSSAAHGTLEYWMSRDAKLRRLYNGDWSKYTSRSNAELALACKLVYYGYSDPEIEMILLSAGVGKAAEEAKRKRSLPTYMERTIAKAHELTAERQMIKH